MRLRWCWILFLFRSECWISGRVFTIWFESAEVVWVTVFFAYLAGNYRLAGCFIFCSCRGLVWSGHWSWNLRHVGRGYEGCMGYTWSGHRLGVCGIWGGSTNVVICEFRKFCTPRHICGVSRGWNLGPKHFGGRTGSFALVGWVGIVFWFWMFALTATAVFGAALGGFSYFPIQMEACVFPYAVIEGRARFDSWSVCSSSFSSLCSFSGGIHFLLLRRNRSRHLKVFLHSQLRDRNRQAV